MSKPLVIILMDADFGDAIELHAHEHGELRIFRKGKKLAAFWSDQLQKVLDVIEEQAQ